ncbi:MAG: DUF2793 domain-containing protein [Rhodobacteraceae bacterium]|nr:DUF2793 domain-containing protein [Paracoccaceae bacterium]
MSNTYNFALPLVQAAQAQKHVTVNEALARVDAVTQMRLVNINVVAPPAATDGMAYGVGVSAIGDWVGHDGEIAIYANGGWVFLLPKFGWKAWNENTNVPMVYDGVDWQPEALVVSIGGAATFSRIAELDHVLASAATSTTIDMIPQNAVVYGVTARIISEITGAGVSSWSVGVPGSPSQYGSGLGLALNSYAHGLSGSPQAYYGATPLVITADAGSFSGGVVRLAVHYLELGRPRAV